jgi:hypothetical protein
MARSLCFIFILSACSIIEDSDITSRDELDNISLKSVEITVEGTTAATLKANTTSVTHTEIAVPNGILDRQVWMDWPVLNSKIKVRSGVTKAFKTYTSFLEGGKPYTFYLFDSDSTILELYRFRYDSKGRLSLIVTLAPYVEGAPATTRDSMVYNNPGNASEITSIIRNSSDATKVGTFTINGGSTVGEMFTFTFRSNTYSMACQGNGCGPQWGGNHHVSPGGTSGFPTGVMNVSLGRGEFYLQDVNKDVSSVYCNNQCRQGKDTYYLHPLFLFKDQFEMGEPLLYFYMVDWWQPISTDEATTNEKVTFSFEYDL